jgi:hypothetical protein
MPKEIRIAQLLRPHWKGVGIALLAVIGITAAEVMQPWPLQIVLDYVLAGRAMPLGLLHSQTPHSAATRMPS